MQLVKHQNISQWAVTESEKALIDVIYSDKPVSQMTKPEMASVVKLIGRWRYSIGLSKECSPEDLVAMSLFIQENYGFLSVPEIDHAIKLSITGKLGLDNEEVNPFNNFSFLYVGKILNAYLDYKKSIFKQITVRKEEYSKKELPVAEKPSPAEMAESMKDIVKGEYEKWKSNGEITDVFNIVYGYLEKVGKAVMPKEVGEQIMAEARKKAVLKNEKIYDRISFTSGMSEESLYVMYGKNLCTQYFFSKLESIEEFLITIIPEHFTDDTNR